MGVPRQGDPLGGKNDDPATLEEVCEAISHANASIQQFGDQAEARARRNGGTWSVADGVRYEAMHRYLNSLLDMFDIVDKGSDSEELPTSNAPITKGGRRRRKDTR